MKRVRIPSGYLNAWAEEDYSMHFSDYTYLAITKTYFKYTETI